MTAHETPRPGDFGLSTIDGATGALVRIGQWFLGRANKIDRVQFTHAFIVTSNIYVPGGSPQVVQAGPPGVQAEDLRYYLDDRDRGDDVVFVDLGLSDEERERVSFAAQTVLDARYSFASYGYLFLLRLGLPSEWLRRRVAKTDRFICSQLVDEVYRRAGIHLFNDGREPQNVTPGDLARLALTDPRARVLR